MDVNTINVADTTKRIASAVIYVRFKRRSSNYSCQLIFSRSILVLKVMSNDYIVQRALKRFYKSSVKLTHSQYALQLLNNRDNYLKFWTLNSYRN